jgi:cystathionine gamma-synthase
MDSPKPISDLGASTPLVSPLFQSSVYTLPDLDTLDRIMDGLDPGFIYARDGHPNARRLAEQISQREGSRWSVVCSSGMAAISSLVLTLVQQGDRIVASNRLYGRTTELFTQELARFGVRTTLVDACNLDAVHSALDQEPARLLFVETMSNPLLRIVDVEALASIARKHGCLLVVDNTFATPVLCRPLELGADLVMESLTKMIGGHGDVTLGSVSGNDIDMQLQITQVMSRWGFTANPFDCWLAERGLATLTLRMKAATANAVQLAEWLPGQRGVTRVVYPTRPDHPERELAERLFPEGPGNMLCFELDGGREAVNRFIRSCPGVPFSPSLGNVTTTLSHPATTSHRHASPAEKKRQGITEGLIRLSVGAEPFEQLRDAMERGL